MPKLHIYKNEKETCQAFAEWMAHLITEKLKAQDKFTIALSGGDTPKQLYKILATDFLDKVEWKKVHVFWGDERVVSFNDEKNNARIAVKTFVEQVGIPQKQIHVIPTEVSPEEGAKQYQQILRDYFEGEEHTFDLAVIGMTEEGAILSLFPGNDDNTKSDSWVIPVYNEVEELFRITLTAPVINAAASKAFLITGKRKEEVVQKVLNGKYDPERYPAQLIQTANKTVDWFLDENAASRLIKPMS